MMVKMVVKMVVMMMVVKLVIVMDMGLIDLGKPRAQFTGSRWR